MAIEARQGKMIQLTIRIIFCVLEFSRKCRNDADLRSRLRIIVVPI